MRTKALPIILLSLLTVGPVTGCIPARSEAFNYSGDTYAPRVTPEHVQIFDSDKPTRKYVKLGRIVSHQVFGSSEDTFNELRRRAASMGADALIEVSFSSEEDQYTTPGEITTHEDRTPDHHGGSEKTSVTTVNPAVTHTVNKAVISAIAIRYQD
jgi:hypothetical protein